MKDSAAYTHYTIPAEKGGSSFYYKINTPGDSSSISPLETDTIEANYRGRFMNGYIFEQSFIGDNPKKDSTALPFRAITNRLIKGFTENLKLMKVGEYRTIVIPQELAYGAYGSAIIPPYSTLKFDIELISVKKKLIKL
jgi:FKBP-type peptidyl-prolyl cis-trans isomerase